MSLAKIARPTDSLARDANRIMSIREGQMSWFGPGTTDQQCHYLAERSRLVAVGFYKRNLQHRFDAKMAAAGPDK